MTDTQFIQDWCQHQNDSIDSDDFVLHSTEKQLIQWRTDSDHQQIWNFILAVNALDDLSDAAAAALAAGPLEELLQYFGELYIEEIEKLAAQDEVFADLLGGVWQNQITDSIWERVCAVRGESW